MAVRYQHLFTALKTKSKKPSFGAWLFKIQFVKISLEFQIWLKVIKFVCFGYSVDFYFFKFTYFRHSADFCVYQIWLKFIKFDFEIYQICFVKLSNLIISAPCGFLRYQICLKIIKFALQTYQIWFLNLSNLIILATLWIFIFSNLISNLTEIYQI